MKIVWLMAVAVACLIVGIGCGGNATRQADQNQSGDLPDFVLNPPSEPGFLFGSGIAEQSSPQLAKEAADARAKREIAKVIGEKVSALMKDFLGQAGTGDEAEVTETVKSINEALTSIELTGCTIVKREYKGGKMYSLAKYPLDAEARNMIKGVVDKSMTSKEAMLSEFRAKQGFEELDRKLEKLQ